MLKSLSVDPVPYPFPKAPPLDLKKFQWLLVYDPRTQQPRVVKIIKLKGIWLEEENGRRYEWKYVPYTLFMYID